MSPFDIAEFSGYLFLAWALGFGLGVKISAVVAGLNAAG